MPRNARIAMCGVASAKTYAPGALHPIIVRGIERRRITDKVIFAFSHIIISLDLR